MSSQSWCVYIAHSWRLMLETENANCPQHWPPREILTHTLSISDPSHISTIDGYIKGWRNDDAKTEKKKTLDTSTIVLYECQQTMNTIPSSKYLRLLISAFCNFVTINWSCVCNSTPLTPCSSSWYLLHLVRNVYSSVSIYISENTTSGLK